MIITQETYKEFYNKRLEDLRSNYLEAESNRMGGALNILEDLYKTLEDRGDLHIFVAYESEEFLGYLVFIALFDHHNSFNLTAVSDAFYVRPDKRELGIGAELIKFAEEYFKDLDFDSVGLSVTEEKKFIENLGYRKGQVTYYKRFS